MYIIDGYNFIHKIPELRTALDSGLQEARQALAGYLKGLAAQLGLKAGEFRIVYDGNVKFDDRGSEPGPVRADFSRGGGSADDEIIALLRKMKSPRGVTVVSDDNMVANGARAHGVRVLRAAELLALVDKRGRSKNVGKPRLKDDGKRIRNAGAITRQLAKEWEVD